MTDIVEQLRNLHLGLDMRAGEEETVNDAIAEIERLRAEVARLESDNDALWSDMTNPRD